LSGGTWIAVQRNGDSPVGIGVVMAIRLTYMETDERRKGKGRADVEFMYDTDPGSSYGCRWKGERQPEVGMLVAYNFSHARPVSEGTYGLEPLERAPDQVALQTAVVPADPRTWIVVRRDGGGEERGTVHRVRLTRAKAISVANGLGSSGYRYDTDPDANPEGPRWSGLKPPVEGMRVHSEPLLAWPYDPIPELKTAAQAFDSVFGTDEPC
jgi:hypothetical protein